jgi:Family of unknown function (DUF5906)/RepB DNA-primase from phage plasmid
MKTRPKGLPHLRHDDELDDDEIAFLCGAADAPLPPGMEKNFSSWSKRRTAGTECVRRFFTIISEQARRALANADSPGLLQLSRLKDGGGLVPTRFKVDDVGGMVRHAIEASKAGDNACLEGRTVKTTVEGNVRGTLEDTGYVFALVIDSAADKAQGWGGDAGGNGSPVPAASLVVETSPGNRHYWFFLDRALPAAEAKALGERMRASANADHATGNPVQPYRVAGTTNFPNRAKQARGRARCATRILEHGGRVWTPEQLEAAFPAPQKKKEWFGSDEWFRAFERGRYGLPPWVATCVRDGAPVGERSEKFCGVVAELKGFRLSVDNITALLEKYPDGIAAKYAGRVREEVESVYGKVEVGLITRLNESHAVVRMGNKVVILDEHPDEPATFMPVEEFHKWFANQKVKVGKGRVSVSKTWFTNPRRRQYRKVVFDPRDENEDHYNLWRGFAVAPDAEKSCEKFLAHVQDNICAGNVEHYRWVIGFLAHMVQRPGEKPGVALVMRGMEGAGKGFFAKVIGRLCPHHYVVVSQAAQLTGRFNSHHQQCLLMFVDEGFWAGDKQGEGTLKHLVTDEHTLIEPKGLDAFMARNVTRLIIASNEDWVVPAGAQARRWCVLDVGDAHACDREYFGAIARELDEGGLQALMHLLATFDLSTVDVYRAPKTAALLEQKEQSMAPHERWWFESLREGAVRKREDGCEEIGNDGWPGEIRKDELWDSYRAWAQEHNVRGRLWSRQQLHTWLRKLTPGIRETRLGGGDRKRAFALPGLDACREAFARHLGQAVDWGERFRLF